MGVRATDMARERFAVDLRKVRVGGVRLKYFKYYRHTGMMTRMLRGVLERVSAVEFAEGREYPDRYGEMQRS